MIKYIVRILGFIAILALPFLLFIRGAVWIHIHHRPGAYLSLVSSMILTSICLFLYFTLIYNKLFRKIGDRDSLFRRLIFSIGLVVAYGVYGLITLSDANTKGQEVKQEYQSLHPILRLSISTLVLFDPDLIVTDASRMPEDYLKMGLKKKNQSLHFKQSSGYVHAVDLRTSSRSGLRNTLIKLYFWAMGFNTLRHIGTADHLHVSLYSHDRPGGI